MIKWEPMSSVAIDSERTGDWLCADKVRTHFPESKFHILTVESRDAETKKLFAGVEKTLRQIIESE